MILLQFAAAGPVLIAQGNIQDEYSVEYLGVADGLASNYVADLIEDYRGIKWMATEGGLNSYDGSSFELYTPRTVAGGLKSENIELLCPSQNGHFWIATKTGGISRYNPSLDQFTSYLDALSDFVADDLRALALAEDGRGRLWIGTYGHGVLVLDPNANKVVMHLEEEGRIRGVTSDRHGNIWYGAIGSLAHYQTSEDRFVRFSTESKVTRLTEDTTQNKIWLAAGRNLSYLDLNTFSIVSTGQIAEIPLGYSIQALEADQFGRLWIGTWGAGLFVRDENGHINEIKLNRSYEGPGNANHRSVVDIHIDDHDLIWLSTAFGGVLKLAPRRGFGYLGNQPQRSTGLVDNNVRCINTEFGNEIWLGTNGGGIHRWKPGSDPVAVPAFPVTKVNAIARTESGLVVASREGVNRRLPDGKVKNLPGPVSYMAALHEDKHKGLWLGSQVDGLYYLTDGERLPSRIKLSRDEDRLVNARVSVFAEDENHLWIGTYGGVHRYDFVANTLETPAMLGIDTLMSPICHDLLLWEGKLYVATPAGLVRFAVATSGDLTYERHFTTTDGLPDDFVTAIIGHPEGTLWGSTSRGLFHLNQGEDVVRAFGTADGLTAGAFNIAAAAVDELGQLYFGGTDGLVFFNPDSVTSGAPPAFVLTSLDVDGQQVKVGQEYAGKVLLPQAINDLSTLKLSYKTASFSLAYAVTDYQNTETLVSQYRLSGLSDQWIEVPEFGNISFTGLRPGNYKFQLRGSRDRVNWSAPLALNLSIPPPPWRSVYAYLAYALMGLLMIYWIRSGAIRHQELTSRTELAELSERKERELTEAKLTFFTNISHELRTPLTLILSPLTDLLAGGKLATETQSVITGVHRNAARLLDLVNQLLDFRKAESGLLQLKTAPGNFSEFAREIFRSFQPLADSRYINYRFTTEGDFDNFYYDRDKMEIVLCNLLSNAFKFCEREVRVTLYREENGLYLEVSDDGPGVPPAEEHRIFDRFVQLHLEDASLPISSGIGLAFTRRIVDLHHGAINYRKNERGGASFHVSLPAGAAHLEALEVLQDFRGHDDESHYPTLTEDSVEVIPEVTSNPLSLLLVDDNAEILSYLTGQLSKEYRIISARDGEEALGKAKEVMPDLVVSDVMMPKMDGIELCKRLKTEISTSHIPVILLTARTSTVFQVNGLREGADDYVTKPFSSEVLHARIRGLIGNREKLRKHYLNQLRFEPGVVTVTDDPEEQFLRQLTELIENQVGSAELSGDSLAKANFMSRSTLFRKLKSLTGLSISAFIRSVRLRLAAERLRAEPQTPISQIAFEVGFKDAKYFRQTFQEQFGTLPSKYREGNKVNQ
ncbi:hybrid sensor histidine kinase/response regulator transcription factor [Lewinella sp. 4G2]|uniref:hybrid sensor histidine kinase/response regulator transcription factor n=1 Tax=Lewinella sp. 4G2 TaxID=1803372 RepID=UPI0007B4A639|nr:hybrid sensor histidine kinase/response regulator transcription factor [Lewinella sp. 4G2]OAV45281.1 hypothetical protein A3850_012600 [Lewinella sp. 4G2]